MSGVSIFVYSLSCVLKVMRALIYGVGSELAQDHVH